eukprot:CAMPEP_0198733762 /NCGR_PEP_ID=MMETSP1475-20131203/48025_1 /TAXON_ID= ORGANISM="Unidentified sp., Strain CCMP1999" /NCGR_SAMPLE_ID=MMETSP1475 /ASSEMBLY_ACC=CAM_ASM_001111 /LENGTH=404 /DNA_ID=CAMNT_0044497111 /DNA_START=1277 /DNA_END=2491 /DNA_ORIENTATION=+
MGFVPPIFGPRGRAIQTTVVSAQSASPQGKKILVLGGTGRVGQSICRELLRRGEQEQVDISLTIGGRNEGRARSFINAHPSVKFSQFDITDEDRLADAIAGFDLVVHAAGPFQRKDRPEVLEAAIKAKVHYQDVCDDVSHMHMAKWLNEQAVQAGISATLCTGIYPGVSNLMASKAVSQLKDKLEEITFSYFTAGTGGAGPTILSTTFLLCAEDVVTFENGQAVTRKPASGIRSVDFGEGIGDREVFLFNLPEVHSTAEYFQAPNVSARFGTAPRIWNALTRAMAAFIPRSLLTNRELVASFSNTIDPVVRKVDEIVGGLTGMRVDARSAGGSTATLFYGHHDLSECVGVAGAAFTWHLCSNLHALKPGVFYPEEIISNDDLLDSVLSHAVRGSFLWKSTSNSG